MQPQSLRQLTKLHVLLGLPHSKGIIEWDEDGGSVRVVDFNKLKKIAPLVGISIGSKYQEGSWKYDVFSCWGFVNTTDNNGESWYSHPLFKRGDVTKLNGMRVKRKSSEQLPDGVTCEHMLEGGAQCGKNPVRKYNGKSKAGEIVEYVNRCHIHVSDLELYHQTTQDERESAVGIMARGIELRKDYDERGGHNRQVGQSSYGEFEKAKDTLTVAEIFDSTLLGGTTFRDAWYDRERFFNCSFQELEDKFPGSFGYNVKNLVVVGDKTTKHYRSGSIDPAKWNGITTSADTRRHYRRWKVSLLYHRMLKKLSKGCVFCGERVGTNASDHWSEQFHHQYGVPDGENYIQPSQLVLYPPHVQELHLRNTVLTCQECHDVRETASYGVAAMTTCVFYYEPVKKELPIKEVFAVMTSLYERLEEADAFVKSAYPKLAWRDLSTIVVSTTELHLQDVTVLSEEVYSGPMGESLRKKAVKRMLLNVGKKMQGKCINCDKQFRNMLPKEMNAIMEVTSLITVESYNTLANCAI